MNIANTFDEKYSTKQLQKLKVILCYMDSPLSLPISIYIKICEARNAIFYRPEPSPSSKNKNYDLDFVQDLLSDLSPYCSLDEQKAMQDLKESMAQISNFQEMLEQYHFLSEYMNMDNSSPNHTTVNDSNSNNSSDESTVQEQFPDFEQIMQIISLLQNDSSSNQQNENHKEN